MYRECTTFHLFSLQKDVIRRMMKKAGHPVEILVHQNGHGLVQKCVRRRFTTPVTGERESGPRNRPNFRNWLCG